MKSEERSHAATATPALTTHNRWRTAFAVLLVVWVLSIGVLGYQVIDSAISLTYQSDVVGERERALTVLERLLPVLHGRERRDAVLELLRDQNPKAFIVATDSTVSIERLTFHFDDSGRLKAVDRND